MNILKSRTRFFQLSILKKTHSFFGIVAIEVTAYGILIVTFKTGSILDELKQQLTGCLIPINEYDSFTQTSISTLQYSKHITKGNSQILQKVSLSLT